MMRYKYPLAATVVAVLAQPAAATLIYQSNFETGLHEGDSSVEDTWNFKVTCEKKGSPWALTVVKAGDKLANDVAGAPKAREGAQSLRMEIRDGDKGTSGVCNPSSDVSHRNEIQQTSVMAWGNEYWYGFSLYLPSNYPNNIKGILHQIKDEEIYHQPTLVDIYPRDNRPGKFYFQVLGKETNLVRESWVDFVFHTKLSYNGFAEIWQDGQYLGRKDGDMSHAIGDGLPNGSPLVFRLSQYFSPDGRSVVQYWDSVRIGDSRSNLNEVAPRSDVPAPTPTVPTRPNNLSITVTSGD